MNRREMLSLIGKTVLGALAAPAMSEAAHGKQSNSSSKALCGKTTCRPLISGALWWFDPAESAKWGASGWRDELDRQRRIGFDLLWLVGASAALDHPGDPVKQLLDLCARRKVQVILDTGTTPMWYGKLDLKRELEVCCGNVERIGERFAGHPAFYAWYIPHEIYMWWDEPARYITSLYTSLTERCRKAANVPVTVSPFFILDRTKVFGDFRFNEPDEYRDFWARLIKASGLDVVMLQDSGEHFSYVTNKQRRPFFRAMHDACRASGAQLWGNVETAEYVCPSIEEYVRLYGRVHHAQAKDLPWRPVPIDRLRQKLELAAEHSGRIVTWGYREFCRPSLGPEAAKWYEEYRAYVTAMRRG